MDALAFKIKIGDRVQVINGGYAGIDALEGRYGVVCAVGHPQDSEGIGVRFDMPFANGHDCAGHCEEGYGRWGSSRNLKIILSDWDN